jgi:cytosine/adenosine deaminase-related metal-dependent hydrolase
MLLEVDRLFDGLTWRGRSRVTVNGGLIRSVERMVDTPPVPGLTALPGLVDAHVHLFPGYLKRLPYFGVTAAVDMFLLQLQFRHPFAQDAQLGLVGCRRRLTTV